MKTENEQQACWFEDDPSYIIMELFFLFYSFFVHKFDFPFLK